MKKTKKTTIIAFVILLLFSIYVDTVRTKVSVPIIAYGKVTDAAISDSIDTVTVSKLEDDFKWLVDYGCGIVLPRDFVNGDTVPKLPVVITFDGADESFYNTVYPLLKKYNLKAELSVPVAHIDNGDSGYCTWAQLKEMSESGYVEIGSLGYSLADYELGVKRLDNEDFNDYKERVMADITKSHERLSQMLDAKVYCFTYPNGQYDNEVKSIVADSFKVSMITTEKTAAVGKSFHKLSRYSVSEFIKLPKLFRVEK